MVSTNTHTHTEYLSEVGTQYYGYLKLKISFQVL